VTPVLQDYYAKAKQKGILTAIDDMHKGQIDHLAADGVLQPVTFKAHDGVVRTANSILTAIDHLRKLGQYEPNQKTKVEWL
jgi:hypothetical protein